MGAAEGDYGHEQGEGVGFSVMDWLLFSVLEGRKRYIPPSTVVDGWSQSVCSSSASQSRSSVGRWLAAAAANSCQTQALSSACMSVAGQELTSLSPASSKQRCWFLPGGCETGQGIINMARSQSAPASWVPVGTWGSSHESLPTPNQAGTLAQDLPCAA